MSDRLARVGKIGTCPFLGVGEIISNFCLESATKEGIARYAARTVVSPVKPCFNIVAGTC